MIAEWLDWAITFHDVGKAIPEFQKYIANPRKYKRRESASKAHAPASLFWWLAFSEKNSLSSELVTAVAAVVWRHHGSFPEIDGVTGLRFCLSGHADVLSRQLADFPVVDLCRELEIELPIDADIDSIYEDEIIDRYCPDKLALADAAVFRLKTQFLFSVLLEADRAFLALSGEARACYLRTSQNTLPEPSVVDDFIDTKPKTPVAELQSQLRCEILNGSSSLNVGTVTLPTGMGKTLIAAQWALQNRTDDSCDNKKIIVVLPFLSVIDQTVREYRDLLGLNVVNDIVLEAHSLAPRYYADTEDAEEETARAENNARDFFADTWQAPIVITTFDQFLYAIFSSEGRHLLRFNNLADAVIVMDEIQAVPPRLWQPLTLAVEHLAQELNTRFLIMSATQPGFLHEAEELVSDPAAVFSMQRRYILELAHAIPQSMEQFTQYCQEKINTEWQDQRVLIVLNTRRSARVLRDALEPHTPKNMPLLFLSADVIPRERLQSIDKIKQGNPCIVVSTQCIEAGVDIDMDLVIRDFAPLDSIIQVAGRCNRRGNRSRGVVRIVRLQDTNGRHFCGYVYDQILLEATAKIIGDATQICEEDVLPAITSYFSELSERKDCGRKQAEDWAHWKAALNVKGLLRGDAEKLEFLVISQDCPKENELPLREEIECALQIENRWDRRRATRALGARIASLTVSVWARHGLEPAEIAEPLGPWWLLRPEFYEPNRGFVTEALPANKGFLLL